VAVIVAIVLANNDAGKVAPWFAGAGALVLAVWFLVGMARGEEWEESVRNHDEVLRKATPRYPILYSLDGRALVEGSCRTCVYNVGGQCHADPPSHAPTSGAGGWGYYTTSVSAFPAVEPNDGCMRHTLPGCAPTFFH
jgi:hypothetical protein